jgi:hypothetical protein
MIQGVESRTLRDCGVAQKSHQPPYDAVCDYRLSVVKQFVGQAARRKGFAAAPQQQQLQPGDIWLFKQRRCPLSHRLLSKPAIHGMA